MTQGTRFYISLFHIPTPDARAIFHQIIRAGWLKASNDYRIDRKSCPGDDLLFCLDGTGYVKVHGKTFSITPGQVVWIDGSHPHAHWADKRHPWELYWLRWRAPWLDATAHALDIIRRPVFGTIRKAKLKHLFHQVFELMTHRPPALEAQLHAQAANIVSCLFEARQFELDNTDQSKTVPCDELRTAFTQMSLYPHYPWRLAQLASLSKLSVPHFCRLFHKAFNAAPIDWLRQERINHAKHRLLESANSIKEIAQQVGYNDAFYFSRDFKRYTGFSPTDFRRKASGTKNWPL